MAAYNADKPEADQIAPFDEAAEAWPQLNKLAFWMATGSGKTLLMHANILQYQHYLEKHGRRRELNRILLLTPNEGLSQQHLREFEAAGIDAELFNKDGRGLFTGQAVEILEVTRLRDEMGDKTIAIDAFEGNNLVLVDEGTAAPAAVKKARGCAFATRCARRASPSSTRPPSGRRSRATPSSPSSTPRARCSTTRTATSTATASARTTRSSTSTRERSRTTWSCIWWPACCRSSSSSGSTASRSATFRPFNIEKPLWIFVGGSVTATLATRDASDIVEILQFLARYVADRAGSIQRIERVLNQGLVTATGKNLFAGRFAYLNTCGLSPAQVFDETLATLFNAPGGGQLYVENLKGATGEVALRLGAENEAFGVINVGDDAKLVKLCEENGLATGEREFSGSLFHEINKPHSPVNLLIGSKKFTEGWSSWRVSTMGLMNVGKGEGAQIIQLFGRGVRLKGYDMSLKRSGKTQLPEGVERPKHIGVLETLGIFGIHADYMAQFRDFLEEEGLPTNDDRIEFLLPVIKNLGTQKLKTIRLKKTINGVSTEFGDAFRKLGAGADAGQAGPDGPDRGRSYLQKNQVVLNWYPKIQAMKSGGLVGGDADAAPNETHLTARHVAFLDLDRLYFELERFKAERGWYNLNLTRHGDRGAARRSELVPPADSGRGAGLRFVREGAAVGGDRPLAAQEVHRALLHLPQARMGAAAPRVSRSGGDDPNFLGVKESPDDGYYRILIDKSQEEIVAKLEELKAAIEKGDLKPWEFRGMKAIWFGRHLYQPLLYLDSNIVEISPAPLNKGERQFVEDLKAFHDGQRRLLQGPGSSTCSAT